MKKNGESQRRKNQHKNTGTPGAQSSRWLYMRNVGDMKQASRRTIFVCRRFVAEMKRKRQMLPRRALQNYKQTNRPKRKKRRKTNKQTKNPPPKQYRNKQTKPFPKTEQKQRPPNTTKNKQTRTPPKQDRTKRMIHPPLNPRKRKKKEEKRSQQQQQQEDQRKKEEEEQETKTTKIRQTAEKLKERQTEGI